MSNKTKVVHSESKTAYNIIGTTLGSKYKVARVPYIVTGHSEIDSREKGEAYEDAVFISLCLNNKDRILKILSELRLSKTQNNDN